METNMRPVCIKNGETYFCAITCVWRQVWETKNVWFAVKHYCLLIRDVVRQWCLLAKKTFFLFIYIIVYTLGCSMDTKTFSPL